MYCGTCKAEMEVDLDDEGIDYVEQCPNCVAEVYADGIKFGWKVAGKDIDDLPEALRESRIMEEE